MSISSLCNRLLSPLGVRLSRISRPDAEIPLYHQQYSERSVREKRFYNIGAGGFRHPCWSNVDMASQWYDKDRTQNIDVVWDISSLAPLHVEDNVAEIVYTSHTIEHLLDAHCDHLFAESHRILKPGGIIRVTCPDIRLFFEGYRRKDPALLPYRESSASIQAQFLCTFASQLSPLVRENNPAGAAKLQLTDAEVDHLFSTLELEQACSHIASQCDFDLQRKTPGSHINWWSMEKISTWLLRAGFHSIRRSAYGQSLTPVLRNTAYFDNTEPGFSVYVEAEK